MLPPLQVRVRVCCTGHIPSLAPRLPGRATAHSFYNEQQDNDRHSTRPLPPTLKCSQFLGKCVLSIIVCNNTALGTNCYTTLRPAMEVADNTCSAKSRKYHVGGGRGGKGETGEQISNLFNQRQLSQREINNAARLRMSGSTSAH